MIIDLDVTDWMELEDYDEEQAEMVKDIERNQDQAAD